LSARAIDEVAGQRASQPDRRGRDVAFAVAACAVLAWYNNVAGRMSWHRRWYPAVNGCAAAAALTAAAASGLSADDLGLRRDRLAAGLRLGAAAGAPVAAAFALAPLTPARRLLRDKRVAGLTGRQLAYQVLVRIPVGTVCWEEAAFRAVLPAALHRVLPRSAAIAVTSAMFGVWHIRPTADALRENQLATGRAARIAAVGGVVASTSAAGALLSCLRGRSGSLAAPVVLHLTVNCAGPLASAVNARLESRFEEREPRDRSGLWEPCRLSASEGRPALAARQFAPELDRRGAARRYR
jgi:membrane protease YdiL (CAAX protease family)